MCSKEQGRVGVDLALGLSWLGERRWHTALNTIPPAAGLGLGLVWEERVEWWAVRHPSV